MQWLAPWALAWRQWPDSIAAILIQQITEPNLERGGRETIDRITAIDDAVSLRVRKQYEENPYPRWTRLPLAPQADSFNAHLRRQVPGGDFEPFADDRTG